MSKFTIYQVLPRLFGPYMSQRIPGGSIHQNGCGKMNYFTRKALAEIRALGITHIWYTGILEHATQTDYSAFGICRNTASIVKGKAGSAYAIKDYYDIDPDLAESVPDRMKEFDNLINRTHREGLKVIIDFVPNHVAREYVSDVKPAGVYDLGENDDRNQAFSTKNNFYYLPGQVFEPQFDKGEYQEFPARATGNDQFTASPSVNDWYETVKLNYGVNYVNGRISYFNPIPDTWQKMRDILLFWASRKVDGFRCDMAEMVPVEFWEWVINELKLIYPELIFIAEVYNPAEYRNYIYKGGFDYLYDKVGLYDTLRAVSCHGHSASEITRCWQSLEGIQDKMLNFLENHDEQRIASDFFLSDPLLSVPALIVSATLNRSPFMVYFGQELGEPGMEEEGFSGRDGRTTIFDYWALETLQKWINKGKYDGSLLSADQQKLREMYSRLLNLIVNEKALREGKMYDLQYANWNQEGYNQHRQYAFLRHYEEELILVVANFDRTPVKANLLIPSEAFRFINWEGETAVDYINLLNPDASLQSGKLTPDQPLIIPLEATSAVILKIFRQI